MKKIKNRSNFAIIIAVTIVLGLCFYVVKLWGNGSDWAMLRANQSVYANGVLDTGTLTDRNEILLASAQGGVFRYADNETVRKSCLHVVGDYEGFIGTGAVSALSWKLAGYSFWNGTNKLGEQGNEIALSIDSGLNTVAYNALAGRKGAVLMMNYKTGEVLCMVSTPTFDPNYDTDLSGSQYEGAYLNRCISSAYVPGSVFKIITLTAAIETIPNLADMRFNCTGSVNVGGEVVTCTGVHGEQTIEQAFANSCNCAFSEVAQLLGADKLEEYARMYGLLDSLDVSGIETLPGSFEKSVTGSADLSWSGIGQYKDMVTPISMLRVVSAIANDGTVAEPRIFLKGTSAKNRILSEETAQTVSDMMNYNVVYHYGEGLFPNVTMHAKTGTAEVGDGTSHAWFAGFIDDASHPYAFVVMIEKGGGGLANAAPVANQVIQAAINN